MINVCIVRCLRDRRGLPPLYPAPIRLASCFLVFPESPGSESSLQVAGLRCPAIAQSNGPANTNDTGLPFGQPGVPMIYTRHVRLCFVLFAMLRFVA